MNYSDSRHPDYDTKQEQWEYSWLSYTGAYILEPHISSFLIRKEQRETSQAYQERKDLTDPVLYFAECVDSLVGIIGANEEDDQREWGGLGDPETPGTHAYNLLHNADGNGTNWTPTFKQVGIRLTVQHTLWGLVEGIQTGINGETIKQASVKLIDPQSVVNWWPSDGNPQEVLVKERKDVRSGIQEDEEIADVFVRYTLDGWERFRVEEHEDDGEVIKREIVIDSGEYTYYSDKRRTMRILPIFPVKIPMPRHVGYLLAKKQNHIFNKKSRRDFALMNMSFALGVLKGTQEQYTDFLSNINKGFNWLREDPEISGTGHRFMSPGSEYLTEYNQVLEKDKADFYSAAFKQYADAAKQVTATEIRLESKSGIEAFLSLLVTSIDEFENDCLWRLEQVYFPDKSESWGTASVNRSMDFQASDISEAFNNLAGGILNADRAEAISTRQKVRMLHPEWTDEQVDDEVSEIRKEIGIVPEPE